LKQLIEDIKLIVGTDKRIWAFIGFIAVVLIFWSLTSSWRPLPEIEPTKHVEVEVAPNISDGPLFQGLSESLHSLSQTNELLQKDIERVSKNMGTKQEEIDWDVDKLVSRLSNMSSTLDNITKKVGERQVEKFEVGKRMERRAIKQNK
jgi:hypothetical protein